MPWAATRNLFPVSAAVNAQSDLGAVGDGATDDSGVLVSAVANTHGELIFVPAGTYLIHEQLRSQVLLLNGSRGLYHSDTWLIGESAGNTTLRLADHSGGFSDSGAPQAVLYTATQNPYLDGGGAFCLRHSKFSSFKKNECAPHVSMAKIVTYALQGATRGFITTSATSRSMSGRMLELMASTSWATIKVG